jgi:creatinine amidohydrolase/Fe(II)-dependent formamide hydrolase-like protein
MTTAAVLPVAAVEQHGPHLILALEFAEKCTPIAA